MRRNNWPRAKALLLGMLCGQLVIGDLMAADHAGVVRFGGLPLPGVTVTATQGATKRATVSGPDGSYKFTDMVEAAWTLETNMLLFAPQKREVTPPANAEWDLVLVGPEQISAIAIAPASTPAPPPLVAGSKPAVPAPKPGAAQTNTRTPFQRTELNAAARTNGNAAAVEAPAPAAEDTAELRNRAADGLLVNGSVNNGAASPFSQLPAFGNNRRGLRSLYNGNIGVIAGNSALNARSYSITGQDTPRPQASQLQGVAAFGGPLRIPHLLPRNGPQFNVQYQWTRNTNVNVQTGLMPTADQRAGILGNGLVIPESQIVPQAKLLLGLYPLPNFTGNSRFNYQLPLIGHQHADDLQARSSRSIGRNNRDQLSGTFAFQSNRSDNTNLVGFLNTGRSRGLNTTVAWRHSFNPRFFMNTTSTFSRQSSIATPFFANRFNVAGAAGITGTNQTPLYWGPPSLNFSSGISGLSDQQAASNHNQTSGIATDLFYARGRHNWTGGGGFRRQQFNILSQQDPRGSFTFNGLTPGSAGSDFANFLVGRPDGSSISFGNADKYLRATNGELWASDDWRVNPGLTLNLGVRWEYWGPVSERQGRLVNLALAPGFTSATPVISGSPIQADRNNIAPRVAFSWRPLAASSMVVRGGYGIYYDTSVYQPIAQQMAQQAPLSKNLRISNSAATPITLADGFSSPGTTTTTTYSVDPQFRLGYSQNWQLSLQRDLPWALQMTASYNGTKGTRQAQQILPNTFPTGAINPCPTCPAGFTYLTSNGNSIRNAGVVQIRRRLRSGFTAQGQYTYAKAFDNGIVGGRGVYIAQNWLDLGAERGRSVFDQRHQVTGNFQYTSGMGLRGNLASNWKGKVLRDWTFGSQATIGTGLPLNPVYPAIARGTGVTGTLRPDLTGADLYAAPAGLQLNPAAYAAPKAGQWGNAPRNSINGPSQFSMNANMSRSFQMKDRYTLNFRIDANNVLNAAVVSRWDATVTSAQFGLPVAYTPMRSIQTSVRMRF